MLNRLVGNCRVKKVLSDMISSGRLVHSFIIEGEEGVGRHTLSAIIAAAAVCENTNIPCGVCRPCELASKLNHPDISVYAPTKSRFSVETVREIRREAYIMPIELRRRIFVLENADLMTAEAANALLKVLEEPPGSVMFMLLVKSAAALPVTIRSRCVILSLTEPEFDEAFAFLSERYSELPDEDVTNALRVSQNNIGRAGMILKGEEGGAALASAQMCVEYLVNPNSFGLMKLFAEYEKNQHQVLGLLNELRILLVQKLKDVCQGACVDFSQKELLEMIDIIDSSLSELNSNCNTSLVLTLLALRLQAVVN